VLRERPSVDLDGLVGASGSLPQLSEQRECEIRPCADRAGVRSRRIAEFQAACDVLLGRVVVALLDCAERKLEYEIGVVGIKLEACGH
jgi:hypothetical protein